MQSAQHSSIPSATSSSGNQDASSRRIPATSHHVASNGTPHPATYHQRYSSANNNPGQATIINVTEASRITRTSPFLAQGPNRTAPLSNLVQAAQRAASGPQGGEAFVYYGSSADVYASAGMDMNRPETSMSMLSGSEYLNDESSHGGSNLNAKRASVLSFQTALSGHYVGTSSRSASRASHAETRESLFQDTPNASRQGARVASGRTYAGGSSSGNLTSSEEELQLPGGWMSSSSRRISPEMRDKPLPAEPPARAAGAAHRDKNLPDLRKKAQDVGLLAPLLPEGHTIQSRQDETVQSGVNEAAMETVVMTNAESMRQSELARTSSLMEALKLEIPAEAITPGDLLPTLEPLVSPGSRTIATSAAQPKFPNVLPGADDDAQGSALDREKTITNRKGPAGSITKGVAAAALPSLTSINSAAPSALPLVAAQIQRPEPEPALEAALMPTSDSNATLMATNWATPPVPAALPVPPVKDEKSASPQLSQVPLMTLPMVLTNPGSCGTADQTQSLPPLQTNVSHLPAQRGLSHDSVLSSVPPGTTSIPLKAESSTPIIQHSPVADFRATPLANVGSGTFSDSPAESPMTTADAAAARKPLLRTGLVQNQAMRRGSSTNLLLAAAVAHADEQQHMFASTSASAAAYASVEPAVVRGQENSPARSQDSESPSREPSPPPDGEIEARAEWERARMKKSKGRDRSGSKSAIGTLSPQEVLARGGHSLRDGTLRFSMQSPNVLVNGANDAPPAPPSKKGNHRQTPSNGSGPVTTQQLQKLHAKEQRHSVGHLNMTAEGFGHEQNGPYPAFPSSTVSISKVTATGKRQYPGMMPQRSLVPPFELQQRPDALLSGLIGPDGVRKSLNDPDVCLECMMRDEDMIDVTVVGEGMWERESDKGFADAIHAEKDEEVKVELEKSACLAAGEEWHPPAVERLVAGGKFRVKRIAHGDPLTAERLKLHTQMSIPASSHRWRTLQAFLAVQAKYIAMEQRTRGESRAGGPLPPAPVTKTVSPNEYDNCVIRASLDARGRPNSSAPLRPGDIIQDAELDEQARLEKERDIANARAARRKMAASAPSGEAVAPKAMTASSLPPAPGPRSSAPVDDLSMSPAMDLSAGHHSLPKRSGIPAQNRRAGSAQDLRSVLGAMAVSSPVVPDSPHSLAPPGSKLGARVREPSTVLSPSHSGSMIDMHLGFEDHQEHRIAQNGFMPGTPLRMDSPGALNRAFYGFPGDGDAEQQVTEAGLRQLDDEEEHIAGYPDPSLSDAAVRRKKKGLRGLFSKLGNAGREGVKDDSNSKRSTSSGSPRVRAGSLGPDDSMDLAPPPGLAGLMNRARRSTTSLRSFTDRENTSGATSPGPDQIYNHGNGMASQASLDPGPFGAISSPLPSRKEPRNTSALRTLSSSQQLPSFIGETGTGQSSRGNGSRITSATTRVAPQGYGAHAGSMPDDRSSVISSSRGSFMNSTPAMAPLDGGFKPINGNVAHSRVPSGPPQDGVRGSTHHAVNNGISGSESFRQSAGSSYYRGPSPGTPSNGSVPASLASPSSRNWTDSTLVNSPLLPRRPPRSPQRRGDGFDENASVASEEDNPGMFAPVGFPVGTYLTAEAAAASAVPGKFVRQLDVDAPVSEAVPASRSSMQLLAARSGLTGEKDKDKSVRKRVIPKFGFGRKKSSGTTRLSPDQSSLDSSREPRKSMTISNVASQFLRGKNSQNNLDGYPQQPYPQHQQPQQQQQHAYPADRRDGAFPVSMSMAASLADSPMRPSGDKPGGAGRVFSEDRKRVVSTTMGDRGGLPPRSQSALGILSRDHFGAKPSGGIGGGGEARMLRIDSEMNEL